MGRCADRNAGRPETGYARRSGFAGRSAASIDAASVRASGFQAEAAPVHCRFHCNIHRDGGRHVRLGLVASLRVQVTLAPLLPRFPSLFRPVSFPPP